MCGVKCETDAPFQIWKHIQPVGESAADVFVELREGSGILKLRLAALKSKRCKAGPENDVLVPRHS